MRTFSTFFQKEKVEIMRATCRVKTIDEAFFEEKSEKRVLRGVRGELFGASKSSPHKKYRKLEYRGLYPTFSAKTAELTPCRCKKEGQT